MNTEPTFEQVALMVANEQEIEAAIIAAEHQRRADELRQQNARFQADETED